MRCRQKLKELAQNYDVHQYNYSLVKIEMFIKKIERTTKKCNDYQGLHIPANHCIQFQLFI